MHMLKGMWIAALAVGFVACRFGVDGQVKGTTTSPRASIPARGVGSGASPSSEEERAAERKRRWAEQDAQDEERRKLVAVGRLKLNELVVIEPANGVPKVPPMRPTWCDVVPRKKVPSAGSLVEAAIVPIRDRGWDAADHFKVAAGLCASPDDPDYQRQTGYVLQAWTNATGRTVAEGVSYLTQVADPEARDASANGASRDAQETRR